MKPSPDLISQKLSRGEHAFIVVARAIPFAALGLMILSLAREGIDIPNFDDWRDYAASTVGTYSLPYLFQPSNDTMYPIGKLFDSIFLDALDGNTLIYQLISMTLVLGSILMLTWKLLQRTIVNPLLAAFAFIPTLLILQKDSYWGDQYIAYHQAIPLVCLLAVLAILVTTEWRPLARMVSVFALGIIAGGAYISGAFAGFAMALTLIFLGLLRRHRRDLLETGAALALAAAVGVVAQAYVIIVVQHGNTHRPDAPWATPLSMDFWAYTLGKIGRSLSLPPSYLIGSFVVTVVVAAATVALIFFLVARLATARHMDRTTEDRDIVTVSLAVAIAVYLAMVAAGRANLHPAGMDTPLQIFEVGYARFHFFWITAIWPWVFAWALIVVRRLAPSQFPWLAAAAAASIAVSVMVGGALDYRFAFAQAAGIKERGLACLQHKLISSYLLLCPELYPALLNDLYAEAVEAGAPFVFAAPPTLRRYSTVPEVRLLGPNELEPYRVNIRGADDITWNEATMTLTAKAGTSFEFKVYRRRRMSACRRLNVAVNLSGDPGQVAQLFFMPPNDGGFNESQSQRNTSDSDGDVNFIVSSREGFANRLRLDLLTARDQITISRLTVHCLLP